MRILYYDLETAPNLVYSFNTFKANIGHEQIVEPARIICFSYQWDDENKVHFESEFHSSRKEMLDKLWELLDEADFVVGYNNAGFDDIWVKSELLSEGYPPFSPFSSIDLYQGIKRLTRFPSKKLAYVAPRMLDDAKVTHTGFRMWIDCLNGDEKAWKLMKRYAIRDTKLLKPLYHKLRAWLPNHPNFALELNGEQLACPVCQSTNVQRRGTTTTNASVFQRFVCNDCGRWSRVSHRVKTTGLRNV